MALRAPSTPQTQVDLLVGFTGGMVGILFVITLLLEVTGQPALLWALLLAGGVAVLAVLLVRRRRLIRMRAGADADPPR
jgi:H+/Cl- antiporter ClcA